MTEPKDQRKHLYDSEDSTVYFLEGLVMDQREDLLGTCAGYCECYKVPHRKGLCNAPSTWRLTMDQREDAYAAEKEHLTQRSRRMRQISGWLNGVSPDPMNPANLKANAGLVSTFWKGYCEMYKVNEGATVPDWWGFEWAAYALARYEQLGIEQKARGG